MISRGDFVVPIFRHEEGAAEVHSATSQFTHINLPRRLLGEARSSIFLGLLKAHHFVLQSKFLAFQLGDAKIAGSRMIQLFLDLPVESLVFGRELLELSRMRHTVLRNDVGQRRECDRIAKRIQSVGAALLGAVQKVVIEWANVNYNVGLRRLAWFTAIRGLRFVNALQRSQLANIFICNILISIEY
jgi:hypothetical protein